MKVTTSCASAASNDSSGHGRLSAGASCTSTPGSRLRSAATKGGDGIGGGDDGAAPDELGRQRAGSGADVEHALPGSMPAKSANTGASGIENRPMKLS